MTKLLVTQEEAAEMLSVSLNSFLKVLKLPKAPRPVDLAGIEVKRYRVRDIEKFIDSLPSSKEKSFGKAGRKRKDPGSIFIE